MRGFRAWLGKCRCLRAGEVRLDPAADGAGCDADDGCYLLGFEPSQVQAAGDHDSLAAGQVRRPWIGDDGGHVPDVCLRPR